MNRFLFCLISLYLIPFLSTSPISLDPESLNFKDSLGRERFFHGVNVVYKSSPYHPNPTGPLTHDSFSLADIENLEEWGFNIIRLGTMWPGVEPERTKYNESYLDVIETIVNNSADHGIYSLLDFHQDVYSPKYCGEGIPLWASITGESAWLFPRPLQWTPFNLSSEGLPSNEDCGKFAWATFYLASATGSAFQNLYDNYDGLQDALGLFWKKIAERFHSFDKVFGYELINEPWAGDHLSNPLRLLPGYADKHNLGPMYDNLNNYIREIDDKHIVFFEPVTWDDFIPMGFEHAPGGNDFANRSAISYHYYQLPCLNLRWEISGRQKDQQRLRVGSICTEFDIFTNDFNDISQSLDLFDDYLQSWIGWDYKNSNFYLQNFTANLTYIRVISRTYAQAVAGKTKSMKFDSNTRDFSLSYEACSDCGETEIYLNEDLHYEQGFNVTLNNENLEWYQPKKNRVHVRPKTNLTIAEGSTVSLLINRKDQTLGAKENEFLK